MRGTDFARRTLEVAGDNPEARANAAVALAYFSEDIDAMMALIDGALALNPSFARGWSISAMRRVWAGQPDIAIEHAETALRLSPRARVGSPLLAIGAAHFFSRRFDKAVPKLLLAIQDDPSFPEPYRFLAACYAHMGRLQDARDIVARLRSFTSPVIPNAKHLRVPEDRELFLSGLRLAVSERTDRPGPTGHEPNYVIPDAGLEVVNPRRRPLPTRCARPRRRSGSRALAVAPHLGDGLLTERTAPRGPLSVRVSDAGQKSPKNEPAGR